MPGCWDAGMLGCSDARVAARKKRAERSEASIIELLVVVLDRMELDGLRDRDLEGRSDLRDSLAHTP